MTDYDKRIADFVRKATDAKVVAMIMHAVRLAVEAGASDALASKVGESFASDIAVMRGELPKH